MLLPLRSKNPPESFPYATVSLITLNIIVFAATVDNTMHVRQDVVTAAALSAAHFNPLSLLTHMFLHENLLHITGNMWFLYLFGFAVEGRLRSAKFLLIYFASGLAGGLLQMAVSPHGMYGLGASGAIMGVLGAALYLFPYSQVQFFCGIGYAGRLATWSMIWVAVYFIGMDVLLTLISGTASGVAHLAHIGGAAAGFGVCLLLKAPRDNRQASDAKAIYDQTKDLSRLSSADLAAMAQNNPNDTRLILSWMHRNIRDGQIRQDCSVAFLRLLPSIIQKEQGPPVGFVLISLISIGMPIQNTHVLRVAQSVANVGEVTLALRLYDCVLRNPKSTPPDLEAALFRKALACEQLNNRQQAASTYTQFIQKFPMSPMAPQAKMRLEMLPVRR
ncbi:MAG TPA: rhomboid family intramembrane serine protease [Fimbriimonadaceae bacterium]|jgi:membrane associated rhomboid family serine protease